MNESVIKCILEIEKKYTHIKSLYNENKISKNIDECEENTKNILVFPFLKTLLNITDADIVMEYYNFNNIFNNESLLQIFFLKNKTNNISNIDIILFKYINFLIKTEKANCNLDKKSYIDQLHQYMKLLNEDTEEPIKTEIGILTNGKTYYFINKTKEIILKIEDIFDICQNKILLDIYLSFFEKISKIQNNIYENIKNIAEKTNNDIELYYNYKDIVNDNKDEPLETNLISIFDKNLLEIFEEKEVEGFYINNIYYNIEKYKDKPIRNFYINVMLALYNDYNIQLKDISNNKENFKYISKKNNNKEQYYVTYKYNNLYINVNYSNNDFIQNLQKLCKNNKIDLNIQFK